MLHTRSISESMLANSSIRSIRHVCSKFICKSITLQIPHRDFLNGHHCLDENVPKFSSMVKITLFTRTYVPVASQRSNTQERPLPGEPCKPSLGKVLSLQTPSISMPSDSLLPWLHVRHMSNVRHRNNSSIELNTDNNVVKFSFGQQPVNDRNRMTGSKPARRIKMSKRAKLNELRFYRLKAKKKMNSPNPEVRIRYKLEKAKRKEEWLIEKLRKFVIPKAPNEVYDPEILTEEEWFYLKRTGEKKKHYVPVGRRGVFGGVVLNMHLHWKNHETVKVVCRPCGPGQIHAYAEELARLSKGIVIEIKPNNIIIFYRGKNYIQPKIMSPPDTLSKAKALEKYKFEQSLEHTSHFIEKLEHELDEYHKHLARFKKGKENVMQDPVLDT